MPWGYRAFTVVGDGEDAFLRPANTSPTGEVPLEYPLVEALCAARQPHRAPDPNCMCGYHAYAKMGGACDYVHGGSAWIMAECWGHGRVEVCQMGWRSQRLQVVRFYYPLCQSDVCRNPAEFYEVGEHGYRQSWPPVLHFYCQAHQMAADADRAGREFDQRAAHRAGFYTEGDRDEGQMVLIEKEPARAGRIDVVIAHLAKRFEASVYDVEATLGIYEENLGWRRETQERIDRETRLAKARREAAFEKARAQQRMALAGGDPF